MSCGGRYSLCIPQGSTYGPIIFRLRHTIVLSAAASATDTTLNVSPIPYALSSGDTLTFGTVIVTLSANASISDRTLSVDAISGAIAKSTTATGDPVDLTGKNVRASIRKDFADTSPLANFTCAVISPATSGEVSILLPSTVSATLPANIRPTAADDIVDLQASTFPDTTEKKLFLPGYSPFYWDLEVFDTVPDPPVVTRYVYGLVICTAEATK